MKNLDLYVNSFIFNVFMVAILYVCHRVFKEKIEEYKENKRRYEAEKRALENDKDYNE